MELVSDMGLICAVAGLVLLALFGLPGDQEAAGSRVEPVTNAPPRMLDEVVAVVVHQPANRLVDDRQLDVSQVGADVDDARAFTEAVDGQLDERRGRERFRQVGAHVAAGCPAASAG